MRFEPYHVASSIRHHGQCSDDRYGGVLDLRLAVLNLSLEEADALSKAALRSCREAAPRAVDVAAVGRCSQVDEVLECADHEQHGLKVGGIFEEPSEPADSCVVALATPFDRVHGLFNGGQDCSLLDNVKNRRNHRWSFTRKDHMPRHLI